MSSRRAIWLAASVLIAAPISSRAADPQAIAAPVLKTGDLWVFDGVHERGAAGFSQDRFDVTIDRVGSETMLVGVKADGAPTRYQDHMVGLDWSERRLANGLQTTTVRPFAFPMTISSSWIEDFDDPQSHGLQTSAHFHNIYKVVGWEDVTVPAGTFHAIKIEANGVVDAHFASPATAASGAVASASGATTISHVERPHAGVSHLTTYKALYYAPDVKYFVKSVEEQYNSENVRVRSDTSALVSFKPQP